MPYAEGGVTAIAEVRSGPTFADGRLPGLDGLRAIAVAAVFLFHADISWVRGGFLGVDLFFVISGFLITGLLVGEIERTGRLKLADFYVRRARRLLPASYLMTVAVILTAAFVAPDALPRLRSDTLASIAYLTNWELIYSGKSYFADIARQPLLLHLWSLAIEEQFYIVWAPVLYFLVPRLGRRALALMAGGLAVASIAWMAVLAAQIGYPDSGADPTRLYFGTDTHGFGLLIGAMLGLLWRPNHQARATNPAVREGVFLAGLLPLAATLTLMGLMGEETAWLYPWGFLLSALTSAALIMAATYRSAGFGAVLDLQPLRWLGERSYGLYLWHWPIFMLTRPDIDLHLPPDEIFVLRLALTLGISALSYKYVEQPIRHGALGRAWMRLRSVEQRKLRHFAWRAAAVLTMAGAAVGTAAVVLIFAPAVTAPAQDVLAAMGMNASTGLASIPPGTGIIKPIVPVAPKAPAKKTAAAAADVFTGEDLTAVGDSVLLGSSAVLTRTLPGAHVYATVGWQAANVLNQLKALADAKALTPVVLIHLGTNGYVTEDQLRQMLTLVKAQKRVILVNTHVPRRWQDANNELIERVARDFPNVVVADWNNVSQGQPDFFVSDGVHLTVPGMHMFVAELMRAGHLVSAVTPDKTAVADIVDPSVPLAYPPGDLSKTLVRNRQETPPAAWWQRLAACETGGKWTGRGEHAGGLAIFQGSWTAWGGTEFAPTPDAATPAQQIAVADRIATDGWARPDGTVQMPVGFGGWGCVSTVGKPATASAYTFTPDSVLAQRFHMGERGDVVRDLELMLGMKRDGIYGRHTRKLHLALLKSKRLSLELAAAD
ncbi:MAG: acyltransferase family protein [Rhizomicrobium sp.]